MLTLLAALAVGGLCPGPAHAEDAVTEWTVEADRLGQGGANWHSLAIMHMAMHDAVETIERRYGRWFSDSDDRAVVGLSIDGSPEAAIASAAAEVLIGLHPAARGEIDGLWRSALAHVPAGAARDRGVALGAAIGQVTLLARKNDGYRQVRPFIGSQGPGRWRPAPPCNEGSNTTGVIPFLFASRIRSGARPPPALDSATFARDVVESNLLGGLHSSIRSPAQSDAAEFWAYQSSQRGFVLLAIKLLDADGSSDLADRARLMSLLTAGMADAAVLAWAEKERYSFWRPITVLQGGTPGIPPKPGWEPMIETPPHPEYPSGHAADCFTGAGILAQVFGVTGPIDYVAQSALASGDTAGIGMGQHSQSGNLHARRRPFASLQAAADECAASRIWAGAHFRSANEESHRLADAIAAQAGAALPRRRDPP